MGHNQEEERQNEDQYNQEEERDEEQPRAVLRRSKRIRRAPRRLDQQETRQEPRPQEQLSPRTRKRIKSLAARKAPREEWMVRVQGEWQKYRGAEESD